MSFLSTIFKPFVTKSVKNSYNSILVGFRFWSLVIALSSSQAGNQAKVTSQTGQDLLAWCQEVTATYPGVKIKDLTICFRSGLALCAIIHHFQPEAMYVCPISLILTLRVNAPLVFSNTPLPILLSFWKRKCDAATEMLINFINSWKTINLVEKMSFLVDTLTLKMKQPRKTKTRIVSELNLEELPL